MLPPSDMKSIGQTEFEKALQVLEQDQRDLIPTAAEGRRLRRLTTCTYLALGVFGVISVLQEDSLLQGLAVGVFGLLSLCVAWLFWMSLPAIRKFRRHARLRKRLGVERGLKEFFATRRSEHRVQACLTLLIAPLGPLLAAFYVGFLIAEFPPSWSWEYILIALILGAIILPFGASLLTQYWLRRAAERIDVVAGVLAAVRADKPGTGDYRMPEEMYQGLAKIERHQIIQERLESVRKHVEEDAYVLQPSRSAMAALLELDPETEQAVRSRVFSLMHSPSPTGADVDSRTGLNVLAIEGTHLRLTYEVDESAKRIRIHSLEPCADTDSDPRHAS